MLSLGAYIDVVPRVVVSFLIDLLMTTPNLTPSLTTCKSLARAGFPQSTAFAWGSLDHAALTKDVVFCSTSAHPSAAVAAPLLSELLARLPSHLDFAVPHPILGTVDRAHTLQMGWGNQSVFGYHLAGAHEVQHRTVHASAVEAAALLYLTLHAAGLLPSTEDRVIESEEAAVFAEDWGRLAKAA